MIFLILLSLFFCWLAISTIKSPTPFTSTDLAMVLFFLSLALLCAKLPYERWSFSRFLTKNAIIISENPNATVHCNSPFDAIFDNELRAGHATTAGEIVFQHSWCKRLKEHLADPKDPTERELFTIQLFAHEAMHARGELNEKKTDCQAIQRNYRTAKLLGVPADIAKENAMTFYQTTYRRHPYFSKNCVPGSEWDEGLHDSTWNA